MNYIKDMGSAEALPIEMRGVSPRPFRVPGGPSVDGTTRVDLAGAVGSRKESTGEGHEVPRAELVLAQVSREVVLNAAHRRSLVTPRLGQVGAGDPHVALGEIAPI